MKLGKFFDYNFKGISSLYDIPIIKMNAFLNNLNIYTLEKTIFSKELNLLNIKSDELETSSALMLLSEPSDQTVEEEDLQSFLEEYRQSCELASEYNVQMVHIITNKKWFDLFRETIKKYEVRVYTGPVDYSELKDGLSKYETLSINDFLLPSALVNYSNTIHNNILIDLRTIGENKGDGGSYSLNLNNILKRLKEFDQSYILINDKSNLMEFNDPDIHVIKESDFKLSDYDFSYVYVYHNQPYQHDPIKTILMYAANSKVVFTNYNYIVNNILPSVILSFNNKLNIIEPLEHSVAFDILNENRNKVMFNYTFINVLEDILKDLTDETIIVPTELTDTNEYFDDQIYIRQGDTSNYICKFDDNLHNLEETLMFPIVFLGKETVSYNNSYIKSSNDTPYVIPIYQREQNISNNPNLSVIIPIHNNGVYLKYKCFLSMLKLSIFSDIEIIFVDDGSSDKVTRRIIDELLYNYPQIVYKRFEKGSGSASRPRNEGMKIASSNLISFLDPDNEAIDDGFSKLLKEKLSDYSLDMVVGNIVREDNFRRNEINYFRKVSSKVENDVIEDTRSALIESKLTVQSIQALIVNKSVIEENNLSMVEGAAGQDTLFYQQLFLKCRKVKVINHNIHSYYAYVEGSVTNTVSSRFFDKFYKVEKERIEFLEDEDLIHYYMEIKFNSYFRSWYLFKYHQINDEVEKAKANDILKKIIALYLPYRNYINYDLVKGFL